MAFDAVGVKKDSVFFKRLATRSECCSVYIGSINWTCGVFFLLCFLGVGAKEW